MPQNGALLGLRPDAPRLRERLRAWWHGTEIRRPAVAEPSCAAESEVAGPKSEPAPEFWTPERIDLAQCIWGREHIGPSGDDYVANLLKPLSLDPSMSLLEIGAGLGAATRMMHKRFGVWPKSYEPDPQLAAVAMSLSVAAGLGKKAPVAHAPLETFDIRANGFDRIILRDVLHTAHDKPALLGRAAGGLKRRGQLLITDFVLHEDGEFDPSVAAWIVGEPAEVRPWTEQALVDWIAAAGLTLHIIEDESRNLRERVLEGWAGYQNLLRASPPPPERILLALAEGERWQRCIAALDSGGLRHCRVIVSRP